jgi:hypothetical protein
MEIYILDDLLRRIDVIDLYESFIWTDRWKDIGDFELVVHTTNQNRRRLTAGTQMVHHGSKRIMTIETVEDKKDDDGRALLTVKGSSAEQILDDRTASDGVSKEWTVTGTPGDIARQIFKSICVDGILSTSDIIPFIKPGTLSPASTIAEPSTVFSAAIPISTVYEAIKELCDVYDLGFRLIRNGDKSELYFEIYTGNDRTTQQSANAPVVFSPDLDNLTNVTELTSIAQSKNVAYVISPNDSVIVYGVGADETTVGFDRRVLHIDASDVTEPAGPELTAILMNKGLDELAKTRPLYAFDGEINQYGKYKYGIHYDLGDLVEMRNSDGATNHMRVTEQIFVSDSEGDRSYPTLTIDRFIMPGTWDSWGNETWDGGDQDDVWDSEDN